MKRVIPTLKKGDIIPVEIIELISPTEMICSFKGDLLRVRNSTYQRVTEGQLLQLEVLATNPLTLGLPIGPKTTLSRHA